jgi:hypothetical protein
MKKERFSNYLKDGIEMLNQGEDTNKVRIFLENVVEKVKKTELSDELKEDLAYYKKINEKFKDNKDIDLKKVEKNIKEYQEERLGQLLDKTVVFGEKFRIDTTELRDDVFDETSEEYDMDFKFTTLNEFLGDDDSLLYERYDLPSEVHSKREEENRDYQLYKEIIMEAKAYGNVVKERFQNITDENGYIEKEDLKELCEDFNFNAEDKFIELNDNIERSPKEKLEHEKKDLENKTETFDFMNKHTNFKEDEEKFKESVKEYQKNFLNYVITTELNETSPNEYRFKNNDFLEKNKDWKKLAERFREVEKVNPIKDNIEKNSLYERYDIKGEDRLYQSILENKGIGKEIEFYEEKVRLDLKDKTVGKGKDFLETKDLVHLYNSYGMSENLSFALGLIDIRKNNKEKELNREENELNKYEKLNERFKNDVDIEFNDENYKKSIKEYQKNLLLDIIDNSFKKDENKDFYCDLGKGDYSEDFDEDFYTRFLEDEYFGVNFIEKIRENSKDKTEYSVLKRYGLEDEMPHFRIRKGDEICYDSKTNTFSMEKFKEDNIDVENFKNIELANNYLKKNFPDKYNVFVATDKLDISKVDEYIDFKKLDYKNPIIKYSLKNQKICDEIYSETETYAKVVKEKLSSVMDENNIIKREDLKDLCEEFDIDFDKIEKNFEKQEKENIELEEKTNKIEYTNNKELKDEIRSYQQDIIEAVVENEFEKISKNEYKLKDDTLLEKENWEKELKTDKYKDYNAFYIFDNTMTRTEMVERYDLDKKLSPFEIYTNDGDLLYNSASENNDFDKIREYAKDNLANYDFEEFMSEDLTKFENWQKITTYDIGIGITEVDGEKKQIYDVYEYTDPVYKELCQEIDKERVNFEEEIRLSFKEHIDNNIIKSDDLLKVFEKFDNGNDKRLENFEDKINNMEISTKKVEEKSKEREKDL